jgi:hypothetical protein
LRGAASSQKMRLATAKKAVGMTKRLRRTIVWSHHAATRHASPLNILFNYDASFFGLSSGFLLYLFWFCIQLSLLARRLLRVLAR